MKWIFRFLIKVFLPGYNLHKNPRRRKGNGIMFEIMGPGTIGRTPRTLPGVEEAAGEEVGRDSEGEGGGGQ
jgi:hypothetical protein